MNPGEVQALADIRGYASAGRWRLTDHARRRAVERGVRTQDVRHALTTAATCRDQGDGTWKVSSRDLDGDDLVAVVVLEEGVLVVTLF